MRIPFLFLFLIAGCFFAGVCRGGRLGVVVDSVVTNGEARLVVTVVYEGSPAAKAGVEVNDIILSFDGMEFHSTRVFIDAIAGVSDTVPIPLVVLRRGVVKDLSVRIYQPKHFWVRIQRDFAWSWITFDYTVYLGDEKLGEVSNNETSDFWAPTRFNDTTSSVYLEATDWLDNKSFSDYCNFPVDRGYLPVLTFSVGKSPFHVKFERLPSDSVQDVLLRQKEQTLYRRMTSDSCLAPRWFKKATRPTLGGIYGNGLRAGWFAPFLQCELAFRMLSILGLLFPIFIYLYWKKGMRLFRHTLLLVAGTVVLYYAICLALFGFMGPSVYMPFTFVAFCTCGIWVLAYGGYSLAAFARGVDEKKEEIKKPLGRRLMAVVAVIELALVAWDIFEICRFIAEHH